MWALYRNEMNPKKFRGLCWAGCGRAIKRGASKYCSLKCQSRERYLSGVRLMEAGLYPATLSNTGFIRHYLVEKFGEKCSRCGWKERHPITGKVVVEVEHIDGDWRNNSPENLTLLCPNCHALTATFRGLNRGRGRAMRRGASAAALARERKGPAVRPIEQVTTRQLKLISMPADVA